MTYNPYPQQPDPSYGYQQPYQPYPQPYAAPQQYPVYGPPPQPQRSKSKLIIIIIVVVVVVMFIVVPIIIAGVLVVYMQGFSSGPGTQTPIASMVSQSFTNPNEGSGTKNGGGWHLNINVVTGDKAKLSGITVSVQRNGLALATMSSISTTSSSLSYTASGVGSMQWYMLKSPGATPKFMNSGTAVNLDTTTAKDLNANGYPTVQGAYFIFIDVNGNSYLDAGDTIFVYSDVNADGSKEITSGCTVQLSMTGATIASTNLS
jgi:hypothetical protein